MIAEVVTVLDQRLTPSEVIQGSELILQVFQRRKRRLTPRGILFAGKDAGKELDCVTQILSPDAQFVALLDVERAQVGTLLPDPLSPASEQLGPVLGDRLLSPLAQRLVGRPGANLDPLSDVKQDSTKAI